MSLKRVALASRAVSEDFREEVTQQLALEDSQDLNMSWGSVVGKGLGGGLRAGNNQAGIGSGSAWLLMVTLRMGRANHNTFPRTKERAKKRLG